MRWGKRISQLLMLIVLCVLIFYAGIYMQLDVPGDAMSLKINQSLLETAGKTYMAEMFYLQECEELNAKSAEENGSVYWILEHVMKMLPLGNYVKEFPGMEIQAEDHETYQMILAKQANDENEVDESGKLVEKKEEVNSSKISKKIETDKLKDFEYLISNFYTVDSNTSVTESLLKVDDLLKKDMTIDSSKKGPKILIYHTHSQEAFIDSKKGKTSDTIMGMGERLAQILNEKYKIETIHHKGIYDLIDGNLDRSKAYQLAEVEIQKILKKYPSIEVVIDLHRDGVKESTHLVTEIDGKQTAQIMFFNGLSRTRANGDIEYLHNPYIEDNLAFSLQMQLEALEKYPGFTRRIYLKSYRYNMHLKPKTLLIEAGAQTNTVAEMKNAMVVLAEILHNVLME